MELVDYLLLDRFTEAKSYDYVFKLKNERNKILNEIEKIINDKYPEIDYLDSINAAINSLRKSEVVERMSKQDEFKNMSSVFANISKDEKRNHDEIVSKFPPKIKDVYEEYLSAVTTDKWEQAMKTLNNDGSPANQLS